MTFALAWYEDNPQAASELFKSVLQSGHCSVIPTDTVYGLAAAVGAVDGYAEIYRIKERELSKPLPILSHPSHPIAQQIGGLLDKWPDQQALFYSGKLTVVVEPELATELPHAVFSTQPGAIGVRVPNGEMSQLLLLSCGGTAWATSFNLSGCSPCVDAREVSSLMQSMNPAPAAAILSRHPLTGRPSRVALLTAAGLSLLRQ